MLHAGASDGANYTYDAAGNRTSKQNLLTGVTENYSYDPLYELNQVLQGAQTTESYTYDLVGNRLSSLGRSPWSYNSSNELTSTPATTLTYDNNGNMLSKSNSAGGSAYAWDFENRMSSATVTATGGTASTVNFKYDPLGRRIEKSSPSGATIYLYDGANIVAEVGTSGAVVASYAQGPQTDQPLAMRRGGTVAYYQADGLGSITSLTNSMGKTISTYVYKAFGATTANEGAFNPFRYTGREQDPETGLYYYRARYYDPSIGRFISEDPIGFGGGENFYRYVENNPTNSIDPTGLCSDFSKCMANNSDIFSLAGLVDGTFGTDFRDSSLGRFLGGNAVSGLLYGSLWDNVQTAISNTPGLLTSSMGTVTTYGRNTSTIISLNLGRSGGLPQALSSSTSGVTGALGKVGRVFSLGLSFAQRLTIDATLAALEAAYCGSVTH